MGTAETTPAESNPAGPLSGIRVIELSHEHVAWAGKLLADMGAEVIVVEPPGGSHQRAYGPFADDIDGPERSLWWWHYNTSKSGVVLDLEDERDIERFRQLVGSSDVLLEAEPIGAMARRGVDYAELSVLRSSLVHCSVTPYGRNSQSSTLPVTDLTVLAEGGPVWSCGYDDHTVPPVRGGGNQGFQTACHYAVMAIMVALLEREDSGLGEFLDVSMYAAANVTTEMATYWWFARGEEVQRQTGRHAMPMMTNATQVQCGDGSYATTGVPARNSKQFAKTLEWLDEVGLRDEYAMAPLLEMGAERPTISVADIPTDPMVGEMFQAARDAVGFVASRVPAYEFFRGAQDHGVAAGAILSPEEALFDEQSRARGFPTEIEHDDLGRSVVYPGAPYRFGKTPWRLRRAPRLGEHQTEVFGG